ncbi:hypothetical protein GCM10012284_65020 [Mangrovihabitans endophyticus]|uniref:Uncharacterized protein n=1 Tax=Mangrovihabitans endophyticus TaxID=1751298 RepID=A0A8J3C917_9ACTN|nr:hypothetical protein GCM10012284_65020 [Mangrovihabitans endophyticus]
MRITRRYEARQVGDTASVPKRGCGVLVWEVGSHHEGLQVHPDGRPSFSAQLAKKLTSRGVIAKFLWRVTMDTTQHVHSCDLVTVPGVATCSFKVIGEMALYRCGGFHGSPFGEVERLRGSTQFRRG